MSKGAWVVYWNEYASNTYLYGSEITFHTKDDIEFHNELMPPGTVIKRWFSKTNYQSQRIEPSLPIIDGECEYEIIIDMDCNENEQLLFRLVFYDKYEQEAGFKVIRSTRSRFRCPLKTYSYELQMINGGLTGFRFHSIYIRDITDGSEEHSEENKQHKR